MKKDSNTSQTHTDTSQGTSSLNRRQFIVGLTTTAAGITIVPRHVLGGVGYIAPSDKVNVAYIGVGTQGLRELPALLELPDVVVTAVCDPQKKATDYYDWGPNSLLKMIRKNIGKPDWTTGGNNTIPGGLDNGQTLVEGYYASKSPDQTYKGCRAYTDFRELLAKEKVDAIKVMTPDHLHGVIAMAALRRGIHISMHKPISNRLIEGKKVVEMAQKSKATSHLIAWDTNGNMDQIMAWIEGGEIGTLKEIHNWSFRPVWPQYAQMPTDKPKIPEGFDWDLWLGPEAERPYHPHYTNMVFRGWYDFGGGSMADMGHYSLWTVFKALELDSPTIIEPNSSHVCGIRNNLTAFKVHNDFSFPFSSKVRFKYPAKGSRPAVDLYWYDGGIRPAVPDIFYEKDLDFPSEGMMFVGDKGMIMTSDFRVVKPYLLSDKFDKPQYGPEDKDAKKRSIRDFIDEVKLGKQNPGSFQEAWPITEAVNLYAAALRRQKTLKYDASQLKITNDEEANKYLDRGYRAGWELDKI